MEMKKNIKWHMLIWGFCFLLAGLVLYYFGDTKTMIYGLISFAFYIVLFYVNVLWIIPGRTPVRNMGRLIAGWFGLLVVASFFSMLLNHIINMEVFIKKGDIKLEFINTFLRSILFTGIFLFIGVTYTYLLDRYKNEKIRYQLETEKLKTELDFLKAQVNPHFLFNTLNNIYALAYKDSGNTAECIMKLSDILRYMLYESNAEWVLVSSEIHYLNLLLSLQEMRIDGPMMLKFSVSGVADKYTIAPLILISLVENVVKHGILNDADNPALIKIKIDNDGLNLFTRNKIDHAAKDTHGGIGMINVKRRIELLYPGKHNLVIDTDNIYYTVNLNLQFR